MVAVAQTWNGSEGTTAGAARATATISRNGDLVHRMYLEISGRASAGNQANPTSAAIVDVELEIGGQKIDKHTGRWMNTWAHLTEPNPSAYTGNVGLVNSTGTNFQNMSGMGGGDSTGSSAATFYFVPLYFWFCRNPGLALPLIALQYHEVKVILNTDFSTGGDLGTAWHTLTHNKLWCDYIYLDTDERRRFAQVSHEYLIEQVQEQTIAPSNASSDLNFNHPVKELIFTPAVIDTTGALGTTTATLQLKLNGHDRFAARNWRYFTRTQIWEHHTGGGGLAANAAGASGALNDSIGVYSFALKPEEHQPSGTCNFSRIDNAQLTGVGTINATICYAVNYNVLRIMSGMGGLAYSN